MLIKHYYLIVFLFTTCCHFMLEHALHQDMFVRSLYHYLLCDERGFLQTDVFYIEYRYTAVLLRCDYLQYISFPNSMIEHIRFLVLQAKHS